LTGVSKNTLANLVEHAGRAFSEYQDKAMRNLTCKRLKLDEIWSFVYAKAKNVAKAAPAEAGDIWAWTAIDADTKLIPSWYVGKRDADAAFGFIGDLAVCLSNRVQLTSDGHKPYLGAVEQPFGTEIDYAMLVKVYGSSDAPVGRCGSAPYVGSKEEPVEGRPDPRHISASYAEQANLSMRMGTRRLTRLTNAFSKKAENHSHAMAIYFMRYNFVHIHRPLRCTSATAAGVTAKLWELGRYGNGIGGMGKQSGSEIKRSHYPGRAAVAGVSLRSDHFDRGGLDQGQNGRTR
jgi:IS1 family transposase